MAETGTGSGAAKPPEIPPWRAGIDAERRRRPRRVSNQREVLRQLTVTASVAAVLLNGVLFAQTAATQMSVGDVDQAILSVVAVLLPGSVRPPNEAPLATPTPAVAVTGAS
jgi:hypothetical protein